MVRIISQNVRGLNNDVKRRSIFHFLKEKADIICLQETHSTDMVQQGWELEFGSNECFWSHRTSSARGACVLVGRNANITVISSFSDAEGRTVGLIYEEAGERFKLLNIYAPNEDTPRFFLEAIEMLDNQEGKRIILGDFNLVLDVEKDRTEGSISNNSKSQQVLMQYIEDTMLCDIWRTRNDDKKIFTYTRKAKNSRHLIGSRIDFILIEIAMEAWVTNTKMFPKYKTDHSAVLIEILPYKISRGRGYWKLNN